MSNVGGASLSSSAITIICYMNYQDHRSFQRQQRIIEIIPKNEFESCTNVLSLIALSYPISPVLAEKAHHSNHCYFRITIIYSIEMPQYHNAVYSNVDHVVYRVP